MEDISYLKLNALDYGFRPQGICSSVYFVEVGEAAANFLYSTT